MRSQALNQAATRMQIQQWYEHRAHSETTITRVKVMVRLKGKEGAYAYTFTLTFTLGPRNFTPNTFILTRYPYTEWRME